MIATDTQILNPEGGESFVQAFGGYRPPIGKSLSAIAHMDDRCVANSALIERKKSPPRRRHGGHRGCRWGSWLARCGHRILGSPPRLTRFPTSCSDFPINFKPPHPLEGPIFTRLENAKPCVAPVFNRTQFRTKSPVFSLAEIAGTLMAVGDFAMVRAAGFELAFYPAFGGRRGVSGSR